MNTRRVDAATIENDGTSEPDLFASYDDELRAAHRVITPPLLAGLTGIELEVCQRFHAALFYRLEGVGSFDGIIATPTLVIGPPSPRLALARQWIDDHPAPDIDAILDHCEADGTADHLVWRTVRDILLGHSLDLKMAVGSNAPLTFGGIDHLAEVLIDVLAAAAPVPGCIVDHLTELSLFLLGRVAAVTYLEGGAEVRTIEAQSFARHICDSN